MLRSAKITYSDGTVINTSLAGHLTDKEISDYYKIGKQFNIGNGPADNLQTVVKCEIMPVYETGATSHAVNDLILFVDNTRELAGLRDKIYKSVLGRFAKGSRRVNINLGNKSIFDNGAYYGWHFEIKTVSDRLLYDFYKHFNDFRNAYIKEFPNYEDHQHLLMLDANQISEFCQLYVDDFNNWKQEHGI